MLGAVASMLILAACTAVAVAPDASREIAASIGGERFASLLLGSTTGLLLAMPPTIRPAWDPNPERWLEGVSQNAARWERGIQNPRASFKQAALAANGAYKNAVTKAVQEYRFAKGMQAVNEDAAIQTALAIGAAGYAAGAAARVEKFAANTNAIKARMAQAVQTVRAMPANTEQEREARMVAMTRAARAAARG